MTISSILISLILSFSMGIESVDLNTELRTQLLNKVRKENLSVSFLQNYSKSTQLKSSNKQKEEKKLSYSNTISLVVKWILTVPIIFHQKVITHQDGKTCTFIPSCSAYGYQAVKRYGLLGVLMTADRLLRCHPANRQYYPSIGDYAYEPVRSKK